MAITTRGIARIRHATTGEVYTVQPDELDWDQVDGEERGMGTEVTHSAAVEHPELGTLTWWLFEYPLGMEGDRETDVGSHGLLENFDIRLTADDVYNGEDADADDDRSAVDRIVEWFHENFEDPAERTPYESSEGGYQWIWGGPYDAREQIGDRFPNAGLGLIEAAVREVEGEGVYEWSPKPAPGDYDDIDEPVEDEEDASPVTGEGRLRRQLAGVLAAIPDPSPGPEFEADETGRIELLRWTSDAAPDGDLVGALVELAGVLATALTGTNTHPDLERSARRYAEAANQTPLSIARLYAAGVHLENTSARIVEEVRTDERPPLVGEAASALASVQELHGALIMSTPEGAALVEASRRYRLQPEAQEALATTSRSLAAAIEASPETFGPQAREAVVEAASDVGQAPRPERSNQTSRLVLAGAVLGAVAAVKTALKYGLITIIGDGLAATPMGTQAMAGVGLAATVAWTFVVSHIDVLAAYAAQVGTEMVWMREFAAWLRRHSTRS